MRPLNTIARCGRGSITMATGKLGVVWDAPGQPIVQVFGMGNIRRKLDEKAEEPRGPRFA